MDKNNESEAKRSSTKAKSGSIFSPRTEAILWEIGIGVLKGAALAVGTFATQSMLGSGASSSAESVASNVTPLKKSVNI